MKNLFTESGMKYWDDFNRRAHETIHALNSDVLPSIRRVSLHITNKCNMACQYCNEAHFIKSLDLDVYKKFLLDYDNMGGGIVHVTGGEPTSLENFAEYIMEAGKYPNISFHLNTNMYNDLLQPEHYHIIKRLKVSLDTTNAGYFNKLVRRKDAFEKVTANLDKLHACLEKEESNTVVSITYTVTKENYMHIPEFLEFYETRWPLFYACFFSSYKGLDPKFAFTPTDTDKLFNEIVPQLNAITEKYNDTETKLLFQTSHEHRTFTQAVRFPESNDIPCYLQLSELVVDADGYLSNCSHLFRDGIKLQKFNLKDDTLPKLLKKLKTATIPVPFHEKCLYGCNKKLTTFNKIVCDNLV